MEASENPQSEGGVSTDGEGVRRLLDEAARAYMDGDYKAAVASWQEVLSCDPGNPRAREGIKKVSMLQAEDGGGNDAPFDPGLEEIEDLLRRRSFDEALEACRRHAEGAGPSLRTALRRLEQRAERARVVEPEIKRCMLSARRSLQAGNVGEALPHLKQVLTLDRSHPVASRLMEGLRERVRSRGSAPGGKQDDQPAAAAPTAPMGESSGDAPPAHAMLDTDDLLPSSGQPGSDAPTESLNPPDRDPAPLGHGLPSSPVGQGPDPTAPEIELDMLSLDDGLGGDDDEVIADAPMEIHLEDGSEASDPAGLPGLDDIGRRSAAAGLSESPFEGIDEDLPPASAPPVDEEEEPEAPAARSAAPLEPEDESLEDILRDDEPTRASRPAAPARPAPSRGGSTMVRAALLVVLVLIAGGAAAWQFDLLPLPGLQQAEFGPADAAAGADETAAPPAAAPVAEATTPAAEPVDEAVPETSSDARRALVLLERAQDLYTGGRASEARKLLAEARELDPMNTEIKSWIERTSHEATAQDKARGEHDLAVAAFEKKEFETALRKFYRLQEEQPGGPYGRYIANSWFNWGLQFLAAGNLREAGKKMDEVLNVQPDDLEAQSIKQLVDDYARRAKDRAFYSQIEALRYRPLDS